MGDRISDEGRLRLLEIFEREGLLPALIESAAVLDEHGMEKHGVQGFRKLRWGGISLKAKSHIRIGPDPDSGRPHAAHALVRCAQLCVIELEEKQS